MLFRASLQPGFEREKKSLGPSRASYIANTFKSTGFVKYLLDLHFVSFENLFLTLKRIKHQTNRAAVTTMNPEKQKLVNRHYRC